MRPELDELSFSIKKLYQIVDILINLPLYKDEQKAIIKDTENLIGKLGVDILNEGIK